MLVVVFTVWGRTLTLSSMFIVDGQLKVSPIAQPTLGDNLSLQLENRDTGAVEDYPGGLFLGLELEVDRGRHCISIAGPTGVLGEVIRSRLRGTTGGNEYRRQEDQSSDTKGSGTAEEENTSRLRKA
jgi:hypothetical protein